jgi:hypothetical protein
MAIRLAGKMLSDPGEVVVGTIDDLLAMAP